MEARELKQVRRYLGFSISKFAHLTSIDFQHYLAYNESGYIGKKLSRLERRKRQILNNITNKKLQKGK